MPRPGKNNKGVALFLVLATLLIVIIMANVIMAVMSSQSRLTHHQVSRIQAYYAALGGVNYAYDMLRKGNWPIPDPSATNTYDICRNAATGPQDCIEDTTIPRTIDNIQISISGNQVAGCSPPNDVPACISATVDYAYNPA